MKKIVPILYSLLFALAGFAQGLVNMANTSSTLFKTNSVAVGGSAGTALSGAGGPYYYAVLTAPSTVTSVDLSLHDLLSAPWSNTGLQGTNTGIAGRETSLDTTVNFWPAGQTNSFVVVGWSSSQGNDWTQVAAKLAGAYLAPQQGSFIWVGGGLASGSFLGATAVGLRRAGGSVGSTNYTTPQLFGSGPDVAGNPVSTNTFLYVVSQTSNLPIIAAQPTDQTVTEGSNAIISGVFFGSPAPAFQWRFNGVEIAGATNSLLTFSNVTLGNSGTYTVVLTNTYGSITSRPAVLQVIPFGAPSIQVDGRLVVGTVSAIASAHLTMAGGFANGSIFYTLDGSTPTTGSLPYSSGITLTNSVTIRALGLSSDFSQTAYAPPVVVQITPVYNLQTSVTGSGTIIPSPTNGPYLSNSVVTLTASAAQNWAFDHWEGDVSGNANPISVIMTNSLNVKAAFVFEGLLTGDLVFSSTNLPRSADFVGYGQVPAQRFTTDNSGDLTLSNIWVYLTGASVPAPNLNIRLRAHIISDNNWNPGNFWNDLGTLRSADFLSTNTSGMVVLKGAVPLEPLKSYWVVFDTDWCCGGASLTFQTVSGTNGGQGGWLHSTNDYVLGIFTYDVSYPWTFTPGRLVKMSMIASPGGVVFMQQPQSQTVIAGESAIFYASASGSVPSAWQWRFNGADISGATNSSYNIISTTTNDAGEYDVVVTNVYGAATSSIAHLTVVTLPVIQVPPVSQTVIVGSNCTFTIGVNGLFLRYQWSHNGTDLSGETNATLLITNAQQVDGGLYSIRISNIAGSITSSAVTLTVLLPVTLGTPAPEQTAYWGKNYSIVMPVHGTSPFYVLWFKDGALLQGATNTTFQLSDISLSDAGVYVCVISNVLNSVTSAPVHLTINPAGISLGLYAGIIIDGVVGKTYGIQYTTPLLPTNTWVQVTNVTLEQPIQLWIDTSQEVHSPTNVARFYRVMAVP